MFKTHFIFRSIFMLLLSSLFFACGTDDTEDSSDESETKGYYWNSGSSGSSNSYCMNCPRSSSYSRKRNTYSNPYRRQNYYGYGSSYYPYGSYNNGYSNNSYYGGYNSSYGKYNSYGSNSGWNNYYGSYPSSWFGTSAGFGGGGANGNDSI